MRFYTKPHQFYCGIDLHARTMYLCILNRAERFCSTAICPLAQTHFSKPVTPYRD